MTKGQAWIKAIRLRTLPLSLAGIILGSAIAFQLGKIDWKIFAFACITTILFQVLSNLANDLGDGMKGTDNDDRIGPIRAIQSGVISQQEMKVAVAVTAFLSLISAGALIVVSATGMTQEILIVYGILALLSIAAAITYTVGKKAYGYNGLGDLMVLIFFGLVSVLGVVSLYTKTFDWQHLLPALSIGLLSTAVLNLNNMRDYVSDSKANKRTLVVMMGLNLAKLYHALLILGGIIALAVFIAQLKNPLLFIALIPGVILLLHLRQVMATQDPKAFDPELKKVALSTFGIALLYFILIWF